MDGVAIKLQAEIYRLESEFHDSSYAATQWHRPHVTAACIPIGGDSGLPREIPPFFQVIVDEVLQQELVHVRQFRMTSYRPDVVHDSTQRPFARLHQSDSGWAQTEFALPEDTRPCRRREKQLWPHAPDQLALLGRDEKCRLHVSQAIEAGLRPNGLIDDGRNPADNKVPVLSQADRNHRLNVQNILCAVTRSDVEVPVLLNWNADETGHRILRRFSQRIGILRRCGCFLRGNLSSRR